MKSVPEEHIRAMAEAARLAPSACNSQTWRFVAVTDRGRIERLCDEATLPILRNPWMRSAPLIIAGCSDLDLLANRVGSAVTGIEYYQIDLGIALEHMALKATELGLGSCWVGWFNDKQVKRILNIPRRVRVSALLAIGYPLDPPREGHNRKPLEEILFIDEWKSPFPRAAAT